VVGNPRRANLACIAQLRERLGDFLRMGEDVRAMNLVEVDVLGLRTFERRFAG